MLLTYFLSSLDPPGRVSGGFGGFVNWVSGVGLVARIVFSNVLGQRRRTIIMTTLQMEDRLSS